MAVLGVSSVTPAFPAIARELGVSSGQVGLLITVFTLPGIVMAPVLGILSDRHGRKKILVPALLLFGIAGGASDASAPPPSATTPAFSRSAPRAIPPSADFWRRSGGSIRSPCPCSPSR